MYQHLRFSLSTAPITNLRGSSAGLTGTIRVLHLSLSNFFTYRTQMTPGIVRYCVEEKDHHQRLALKCLEVLNEDLDVEILGTGYLSEELKDFTVKAIPYIPGT